MFEPQHGTSSEDDSDSNTARDPPEAVESNADSENSETARSRLGNRDWCTWTNCQVMLSETESLCCQEMNVLGDRLDLEGRNETFFLITNSLITEIYFTESARLQILKC